MEFDCETPYKHDYGDGYSFLTNTTYQTLEGYIAWVESTPTIKKYYPNGYEDLVMFDDAYDVSGNLLSKAHKAICKRV
jgi:hypothetical protein